MPVILRASRQDVSDSDLIALANTGQAGTILVGVEEGSSRVIGCATSDGERRAIERLARSCMPPVAVTVTEVSHARKKLLRVDVPASQSRPHGTSNGVYVIRDGDRSTPLTPDRLREFLAPADPAEGGDGGPATPGIHELATAVQAPLLAMEKVLAAMNKRLDRKLGELAELVRGEEEEDTLTQINLSTLRQAQKIGFESISTRLDHNSQMIHTLTGRIDHNSKMIHRVLERVEQDPVPSAQAAAPAAPAADSGDAAEPVMPASPELEFKPSPRPKKDLQFKSNLPAEGNRAKKDLQFKSNLPADEELTFKSNVPADPELEFKPSPRPRKDLQFKSNLPEDSGAGARSAAKKDLVFKSNLPGAAGDDDTPAPKPAPKKDLVFKSNLPGAMTGETTQPTGEDDDQDGSAPNPAPKPAPKKDLVFKSNLPGVAPAPKKDLVFKSTLAPKKDLVFKPALTKASPADDSKAKDEAGDKPEKQPGADKAGAAAAEKPSGDTKADAGKRGKASKRKDKAEAKAKATAAPAGDSAAKGDS